MGNTSCDSMGRLTNSPTHPIPAAGAISHTSGTRNGRCRPGSRSLKTSTETATMKNANKVPELDISASCPTGRNAAATATNKPVISVTRWGVFQVGWIFASLSTFVTTSRFAHRLRGVDPVDEETGVTINTSSIAAFDRQRGTCSLCCVQGSRCGHDPSPCSGSGAVFHSSNVHCTGSI